MTREEAEGPVEAAGDGPMVIEEFLEGGPHIGSSYRSTIFPQNAAQRQLAAHFIAQMRSTKRPVSDRPKLAKLKQAYPQQWKA